MSKSLTDTIPKDTLEIVDQARYEIIATQLIAGSKPNTIATDLGISRRKINEIMAQEDFKAYLKEVTDKTVQVAANTWRSAMADRVAETLKVLDYHLKQKNLEAVKLVVKTLGVDNEAPIQAASNLTVVLPTLDQGKNVIEVPNEQI